MPLTQVSPGLLDSQANAQGFRNRLINPGMVIDQRNNGASVSFNSSSNFPVDRWKTYNTVGSGSTAQRSTTAPAGFNNSILFTVGTGASPGAADECRFFQSIEGFNVADLGFGTANAQTVTISFRVRSSITGTYALNLRNDAGNRSYVATYTIDSANTWETKTVTIAGDTSGTWATDNSTGIMLRFDLGSGSNANTTAGAWQAGNFGRTSACVNWIATNGATFYLTGVQLEVGTQATAFERRDYGRELIMCMRYFQRLGRGSVGRWISSNRCEVFFRYAVPLRIGDPTVSIIQATGEIYEAGVSANPGATISAGGTSIFAGGTTTGGGVNLQSITGLAATPTAGGTAVLMHDALGISAEL